MSAPPEFSGAPRNPAVGLSGNKLRARIVEEIRRCGPIPFSRYMEMCLYEPELGYYARPREQFGKAGDFYTSSDVHAVFGRLLARQFEEMWRVLGSPERIDLIELGAGARTVCRRMCWTGRRSSFPNSRGRCGMCWSSSRSICGRDCASGWRNILRMDGRESAIRWRAPGLNPRSVCPNGTRVSLRRYPALKALG